MTALNSFAVAAQAAAQVAAAGTSNSSNVGGAGGTCNPIGSIAQLKLPSGMQCVASVAANCTATNPQPPPLLPSSLTLASSCAPGGSLSHQQQQHHHQHQLNLQQQQLHLQQQQQASLLGPHHAGGFIPCGFIGVPGLPSMAGAGGHPVAAMTSRRQKDKKEPHIKKPLNAFMLYMKEMRPVVMKEVGLKERQSAEINRILGRKWHELTKSEQQKYYDQAREERQEHIKRYPGWTARDNYAALKKKKKKKDKAQNNLEMKKCRARFGVDQQDKWCKHCRRKKKCLAYRDGENDVGSASGPSTTGGSGSASGWSAEGGPSSVEFMLKEGNDDDDDDDEEEDETDDEMESNQESSCETNGPTFAALSETFPGGAGAAEVSSTSEFDHREGMDSNRTPASSFPFRPIEGLLEPQAGFQARYGSSVAAEPGINARSRPLQDHVGAASMSEVAAGVVAAVRGDLTTGTHSTATRLEDVRAGVIVGGRERFGSELTGGVRRGGQPCCDSIVSGPVLPSRGGAGASLNGRFGLVDKNCSFNGVEGGDVTSDSDLTAASVGSHETGGSKRTIPSCWQESPQLLPTGSNEQHPSGLLQARQSSEEGTAAPKVVSGPFPSLSCGNGLKLGRRNTSSLNCDKQLSQATTSRSAEVSSTTAVSPAVELRPMHDETAATAGSNLNHGLRIGDMCKREVDPAKPVSLVLTSSPATGIPAVAFLPLASSVPSKNGFMFGGQTPQASPLLPFDIGNHKGTPALPLLSAFSPSIGLLNHSPRPGASAFDTVLPHSFSSILQQSFVSSKQPTLTINSTTAASCNSSAISICSSGTGSSSSSGRNSRIDYNIAYADVQAKQPQHTKPTSDTVGAGTSVSRPQCGFACSQGSGSTSAPHLTTCVGTCVSTWNTTMMTSSASSGWLIAGVDASPAGPSPADSGHSSAGSSLGTNFASPFDNHSACSPLSSSSSLLSSSAGCTIPPPTAHQAAVVFGNATHNGDSPPLIPSSQLLPCTSLSASASLASAALPASCAAIGGSVTPSVLQPDGSCRVTSSNSAWAHSFAATGLISVPPVTLTQSSKPELTIPRTHCDSFSPHSALTSGGTRIPLSCEAESLTAVHNRDSSTFDSLNGTIVLQAGSSTDVAGMAVSGRQETTLMEQQGMIVVCQDPLFPSRALSTSTAVTSSLGPATLATSTTERKPTLASSSGPTRAPVASLSVNNFRSVESLS
jgi:hypothetical protein